MKNYPFLNGVYFCPLASLRFRFLRRRVGTFCIIKNQLPLRSKIFYIIFLRSFYRLENFIISSTPATLLLPNDFLYGCSRCCNLHSLECNENSRTCNYAILLMNHFTINMRQKTYQSDEIKDAAFIQKN